MCRASSSRRNHEGADQAAIDDGQGEEDDLDVLRLEEAQRDAHQYQHARYVEDKLGGGTRLSELKSTSLI